MVYHIFQWNSAWTVLILLYSLVFTHPFCKASGSQCFTNEGTLIGGDFPCNPTQTESFCCGKGWACLPNRLCSFPNPDGSIMLARGTCTSRSWASTSQCPSFCLDTPESRNLSIMVTQCDDPTYCCDSNNICNCITGVGTIDISGGILPFTTVGVMQSATRDVSSQSNMTVSATKSAKQTEISTKISTKISIRISTKISTERIIDRVTETVSPTARQSSTETSSKSTEPFSTNTYSKVDPPSNSTREASAESKEGIKIGIAVGVSLGVLIIAFIGIFGFWRERRLKLYMEDLKSRWVPVESYMNQRGLERI